VKTPFALCPPTFALGCLLVAAGSASPLHAQSDPRLVAIVRESQEGAGDSARAALERLVASTPAGDPLLPEMLFVGAVIAPTAQEMQRSLQRITVEHALSAWADDALLKLAQLEYASGNLTGSARSLERIRSDYPSSPLIGLTAFWAARTYFDMRQQQQACEWVRHGLGRAQAGSDIRGQLVFFAQRCPTIRAADLAPPPPPPGEKPAPPRDTIQLATEPAAQPAIEPQARPAERDSTAAVVPSVDAPAKASADSAASAVPAAPAVPPRTARLFRIQVVAAGTQAMADDAVRKLRAMNVESRIVTEGGLLKVRAGGYTTRAQAQAALPRIRAEFPGAFPVMDP
jgi:hypothetical protein